MTNGRYANVSSDAKMNISGRIPDPTSALEDIEGSRPELVHDPATGMRISRYRVMYRVGQNHGKQVLTI